MSNHTTKYTEQNCTKSQWFLPFIYPLHKYNAEVITSSGSYTSIKIQHKDCLGTRCEERAAGILTVICHYACRFNFKLVAMEAHGRDKL